MKNISIIFFICGIFFSHLSAKSMVVLDPAVIEIMYMIDAQDEILAIPDMQNIKPLDKTRALEKVGTFTNPNLEKILKLKHKIVVITSYSLGLKDQLNRHNIQTIMLPVNSLKDISNNILEIGKLTNKEEKARELSNSFNKKLQDIAADSINKTGIFIYSSTPLMAFGGDTLPSDVLDTMGIKNIAQNVSGNNPIISPEYLIKSNPDIIIYGLRVKSEKEFLDSNPAFKKLKAVKNNNIYFLELHSLLRGSPSIIDEILHIKHIFSKKV